MKTKFHINLKTTFHEKSEKRVYQEHQSRGNWLSMLFESTFLSKNDNLLHYFLENLSLVLLLAMSVSLAMSSASSMKKNMTFCGMLYDSQCEQDKPTLLRATLYLRQQEDFVF